MTGRTAPVVVVPDTSPLIHLAAAGLLALLQEFGRVVVMDIVAFEASHDRVKPWASDIAAWLSRGGDAGSSHPVDVATTEIGEAYRLARQADPTFKMKDAGERAIRDWLVDTLPGLGGPALVVYEDKGMPTLIRRAQLDDAVVMATTRALLVFAQERGLIDFRGGGMEQHYSAGRKRQPKPRRQRAAADPRITMILRRYAAGEISSRQAAGQMGPQVTEHDVLAALAAAKLRLPEPPPEEVARDVAALRVLYGPNGPRAPG